MKFVLLLILLVSSTTFASHCYIGSSAGSAGTQELVQDPADVSGATLKEKMDSVVATVHLLRDGSVEGMSIEDLSSGAQTSINDINSSNSGVLFLRSAKNQNSYRTFCQ